MSIARGYGRGIKFDSSPEGVRDGLRQYLAGAKDHPEVLEAAGLGAADLKTIEELLPKLDALVQRKEAREHDKGKLFAQIEKAELALESAFNHYRARVRVAVGLDANALKTALSVLPRRADRRGTVAAPPANGASAGTAQPAAQATPATH